LAPYRFSVVLGPRPNPSLERTSTGLALGPRSARCHHPLRGPSAIPVPARSAQTLGLSGGKRLSVRSLRGRQPCCFGGTRSGAAVAGRGAAAADAAAWWAVVVSRRPRGLSCWWPRVPGRDALPETASVRRAASASVLRPVAQPGAQPDRPKATLLGPLRAARSGGRLALR